MSDRTIAGQGVITVDRGGRRYTYPTDYPNLARIEASIELSSSHDDGDVEGLKVDPERYAAQDAYFSAGRAQSPAFVQSMANLIDPRFGLLVDQVMADDRQVATLRRMGDHLAAGGNIINAVPHGPLLDIGLLHTMADLGLARLGYEFRIGIVISHGVAGRGKRFNDELVCLADALDWVCDKIWYVTPQTPKARQSSYAEVVSAEHIQDRNAVVRADIAVELERGGLLLTVAPSATSNRTDTSGVHWLETPTLGTMRLMSESKSKVAIAVGKVVGPGQPSFDLAEEFMTLGGTGEELTAQAGELMTRMADGMRGIDRAGTYEVGRPTRALSQAQPLSDVPVSPSTPR